MNALLRACRITYGIIGSVAPWGDVGSATAMIERHPYARCWCGWALERGVTTFGAPIYACRSCGLYVDVRRVS